MMYHMILDMSIYINYGINPAAMTEELLQRADVASRIKPVFRVMIKPNLVVARPADGGATTHPEIIEGIIRYLHKNGIGDITIAEGSWVGANTSHAFDVCGYTTLAKKYEVKLVDTKRDKAISLKNDYFNGMKICESVINTDYLINVPVLKGHCQTSLTCCIKNLKGLIPDSEKRRYHSAGLTKPIAALGAAIKPQLHIIDSICGDLDFEEGGNPVTANRIILGFDPVLLDSYCASLIGYHPDEIGYIRLAKDYGAGNYAGNETEIVELNAAAKPRENRIHSAGARGFAGMIDEDGACSACYAALVYALRQTKYSASPSKTKNAAGKIKIGQGYRGKTLKGLGSGNCTAGCEAYVKGCPPTALEIAEFLNNI